MKSRELRNVLRRFRNDIGAIANITDALLKDLDLNIEQGGKTDRQIRRLENRAVAVMKTAQATVRKIGVNTP